MMELKSRTIHFRFAEIKDAEFILSLRTDETYGKYLSSVEDDVETQKTWLAGYKKREELKQEYYFIIQRNSDNLPIGTIRIYDSVDEKNSVWWGSWILNENKTLYSALECTVLIYDFIFLNLGYKCCHMNVRKENLKVISLHEKLGIIIVGKTEKDILGHYYLEDYIRVRPKLVGFIEKRILR